MSETTELDKMSEFVNSGKSEILSDFWDWMMANGFRFTRWEQQTEKLACSNPECVAGRVREKNPDPLIGWTTEEIPEYLEKKCERCDGLGFVIKYYPEDWRMWLSGPEKLFALYAGIDLDQLEKERRQLLDELRARTDA